MTLTNKKIPLEKESMLSDAIDSRKEELFDLLASLIRFRTPNPPGANEIEAQDWVEQQLRELDCEIDRWDALPGRPNVVGKLKGKGNGPTVSLNSHIDVCEDKLLEAWSNDPYDPVIEDGSMYGRGSSDMKSAMASYLFSLKLLKEQGIHLNGNVEVHSVIGEEAAEPGTRSTIERGYGGDFSIVGESSKAENIVATIGVMNAKITIESPETLHLHARKSIINTGGGKNGGNCIEKMSQRIIPALTDLERQWAVFKTHDLIPPGACNINVFRIEGGSNSFILPDRCDAYITVTYLPNEKKADVIREVEEHIQRAASVDAWLRKNPPKIEWGPAEFPIEFAPSDVDIDSEPVRILRDSIEASGREPILGGRGGITDAGWYYTSGIPAVVYGPGDINQAHAVDESVSLDDLITHCKAITRFLINYCGVAD
ncbi:ArgE/DapE family deacylase [Lentibacillus sediminis]|uniref:ArgE/DapE family deacylase n=1 Tax=Lentibacillus sediminis TaxID=1940529 RepID=UPI000C1B98B7|nr:ArgE/DapE family deacylase [Lentibacillus sediminis]